MKRRICKVLFVLGWILIIGIVGGVDCGEPLTNALWCFPIMAAICVVGKIGGLFDEE